MTILVTGATGLIGSALLRELASMGERPRAACRRPDTARDAQAAGADPVIVDFADPQTLGPALAGVHTLFLLGATGPHQAEHEIAVVRAAAAGGVTRVVKLSVWRAPDQLSPFAQLHRRVELEIEASSLEWTFLRPSGFMQTLVDRQAESIRTRRIFAQPRMEGAAAYIDARDIARTAARVVTEEGHAGKAYALSGPMALTYLDVVRILGEVLGHTISYVELSDEQAADGMRAAGVPAFLVEYLIAVSRAFRTGGLEGVTDSVEQLTGQPPTTFRTFVEEHRDKLGG